MSIIDNFLNSITMYRLVFYFLLILLIIAMGLGLIHLLPYNPLAIAFSTLFLMAICWITNKIFSYVFNAPTASESVYITAFVLALIINPSLSIHAIPFYGWAAVWAMASKYMFAIKKKHIFNPAAIAVIITSYGINQAASWWVGTAIMAPFVIMGGLLVVRKIQREDMAFSFFAAAILTCLGFTIFNHSDIFTMLPRIVLDSSLLFLGFVMLTEPLTTPPTKNMQIIYGTLVGFLFAPQLHLGSISSTPELALVIGNIFSYIVSPKQKWVLKLQEKIQISPDLIDFVFKPDKKLAFNPGQYMEYTLPHSHPDLRGNRRYFTLASSPTENNLRLGVKFYENGSTFKQAMVQMANESIVVGGQLSGEFTLPKNPQQKLVLIAGGIGITPYRSMIKYLLDTHQPRQIVLLYADKRPEELMYREIFSQAQEELGIKTIYTLTDEASIPENWTGKIGRISPQMIQEEIPDYRERMFYLSGPHSMVERFEKVLREMQVNRKQIKKDFFPGFA